MLTASIKYFALLPFYLIGAFSSGRVVALFYDINLEQQGSGNVGATNVARTLGKKAGAITLFGDVFKGALAVTLARWLSDDPQFIGFSAVAVVSGHCFAIPGYRKGGKGVATALGSFLALLPSAALIAFVTFGVVFFWKRIVSLSSVTAALITPVYVVFLSFLYPDSWHQSLPMTFGLISLIVVYRHSENLRRLSEGAEKAFEFGNGAEKKISS